MSERLTREMHEEIEAKMMKPCLKLMPWMGQYEQYILAAQDAYRDRNKKYLIDSLRTNIEAQRKISQLTGVDFSAPIRLQEEAITKAEGDKLDEAIVSLLRGDAEFWKIVERERG